MIGVAEGRISPSGFPGGIPGLVAGFLVLAIAGFLIMGALQNRSWKRAGRRAGLAPEGDGVLGAINPLGGSPDLVGDVRGRPVRVETYTRKTGSGEHGSRASTTYTVVSTELDRPIEEGVLVSPEPEDVDGIQVNFMPGSASPMADERGFEVDGDRSGEFSEAIRSGHAEGALLDLTYLGTVSVGDASDATVSEIPTAAIASLSGLSEEDLEDELGSGKGNASTVSHRTEGVILDGDEMERQVEAVVAVAEAAEEVDAGVPRP